MRDAAQLTSRTAVTKTMLWPVLGLIRFYLALIVAGTHLEAFVPTRDRLCVQLDLLSPATAVLGFFIISGFSIAASLEKEPCGFYFRRAVRIVPLYVLAVVVGAVCLLPFGGHLEPPGYAYVMPSATQVVGNLFFLQGFFCDQIMANAVVWTLSIEVFLYLVAPLLARLSSLAIGALILASGVIFVASRYAQTPHYSELRYGAAVPLMAWPWLVGFLAHRFRSRAHAALLVLGVSLIALNLNPTFLRYRWMITLVIVAAGIGFADDIRAPAWVGRFLNWLGDLSYPLYLIHCPLYLLAFGYRGTLPGAELLALAVLAAAVLDRFYDQPVKAACFRLAQRRA